MNIKKITLSIACLSSLPYMASASDTDFSFYGSLRPMVEIADHENGDNFKDALSRVGVKGSHELGDGLTAIGKLEVKVNVAEGELGSETGNDARLAYVGLEGDYGTLKAGRVWNVFYNAVGYATDQLWWNSGAVYYTLDWNGSANTRVGKSLNYTSPEVNGFQFDALYTEEKDQSQAALYYQVTDSLKLSAAYSADHDQDNDLAGLAARYSGDGHYVNVSYMDKDNVGKGAEIMGGFYDSKNYYSMGAATFEDESNSANDFDVVTFGYQHNLRSNVKLWAEFWTWDGSLYGIEDSNSWNFGINLDF